ncbi:glycosyltransferase [Deltaproteobacteria bacterium]|nr:glycosyltransferase [Deltaproteobacteria bacterium]
MSVVISLVSPVYREGEQVIRFLDAVESVLAPLDMEYEIILVDDGSPDDTWTHMRSEARKRGALRCLRLSRNFGKEAALVAGIEVAQGEAVITLDSDLQHPPELIPEMIRVWQADEADVVEARKEKRQRESLLDKFGAMLFYRAFSLFTSMDMEGAGDFKLMDRDVMEAWKNMPERGMFYRGMSAWLGFRRKEIMFTPRDRQHGKSKWSLSKKILLAVDSLTSFSAKPLTIIWVLSFLLIVFFLFVGGEALWTYAGGRAVTGFTTVILLILLTGSAILVSICVLSVYIRQIFYESKARPRYLVSERAGYPDAAGKRGTRGKKGRTLCA